MGIGDEIMVTGRVRAMAAGQPEGFRVAVRDPRKNLHRWHPIWEGNPLIARPGQPYCVILDDSGGNRPYIAEKHAFQWVWREHQPERGEIYLTDGETAGGALVAGCVVVNPTIKAGASPNKQWPMANWQRMIDLAPEIDWVQIGAIDAPRLRGVRFIETVTFRHACGVLAGADAVVVHEGGLHHAAAALGVPAVVIYGGYISPAVTGYPGQAPVFIETEAHPLGCGFRLPCSHCAAAMAKIRPDDVLNALGNVL